MGSEARMRSAVFSKKALLIYLFVVVIGCFIYQITIWMSYENRTLDYGEVVQLELDRIEVRDWIEEYGRESIDEVEVPLRSLPESILRLRPRRAVFLAEERAVMVISGGGFLHYGFVFRNMGGNVPPNVGVKMYWLRVDEHLWIFHQLQ